MRIRMYLHPLAAVFLVIWLCVVGRAILDPPSPPGAAPAMFTFGVLLTLGGFFYEAAEAKDLLDPALQ